MPLLLIVILCAWVAVAVFAVVLCLAARRMDEEVASGDAAPVIDIKARRFASRQHVA